MKILLLEDDLELCKNIKISLEKENYMVDCCNDGETAMLYALNTDYAYDLAIVDRMLPIIDGLTIIKSMRKKGISIPILIITAMSTLDNRVEGLDGGADDYLVKPFDFLELTARIRALLRREFESKPSILKEGKLSIDVSKHKVTYDDIVLNLTLKEYSLLKYLVQNKDKVISSEELINHVWDENTDPFTTVIRVHVYSLRKKLTAVSCNENMIKTIKGVGYLFGGITSE